MINWANLQLRVLRAVARGLSWIGEGHVWLVFRKDLQQPLKPYHARVPISLELADASQMDALAALYHADEPERAPAKAQIYRERLDAGSSCFLARAEGEIVAFNWLRVRTAAGIAEVPMVLQDDEIYTTNAFTAHAWRGKGIHPALNHAMLEHAQRHGYRTAFTMARADNAQSLITMERVGWTLSGTLLCFEPLWKPGTLLWFARGSPYPMPVAGLASLRVPSLAEVHEQHGFQTRELVKARPWSHTYRLGNAAHSFYLKVVPQAHADALRAAVRVARAFPQDVPEVVACNHAYESWMLTREHGGRELGQGASAQELLQMVETYGRLQARAAADPELLQQLPHAHLGELVRELLEFLASDSEGEGQAAAGAALFLGRDEAQRLLDVLGPRRGLLEAHVARAAALPPTLNHGKLHPDNAAITPDGRCVLFNWTRASAGPAGLSLGAMVGNVLPARVLLDVSGPAEAAPHPAHALLERYVRTLARAGYAGEDLLRRCLPASISAGVLLDVLHLARYPMDEPEERQIVAERLAARLEQIVALAERLQPAAPAGVGADG